MNTDRRLTLAASCPDRTGIISRVTGFIAERGGWILESSFHADNIDGRYFMRIEIKADTLPFDAKTLGQLFAPVAADLAMDWQFFDSANKPRLGILVSHQEHCLYDLLARWKSGELDADIPCVISNHETLRGVVEWHGIPFHHVPVGTHNKVAAFDEIDAILEQARCDVIVLARYMQILPPELCVRLAGRILNIHHSFLPSFAGAKPYHQAYQRGVKLIGATCHYVTRQLDEGPIIEQDVIRIDHSDAPDDMIRYGKDIEKTVLARGLRYHLEHRVLIHGNKTVVFR
jgi:formyltetrahydrofolate deformylase